jgi:hypothetical protein
MVLRARLSQNLDGSPEDTELLELIVNFCEFFCQYKLGSPNWKNNSRHWNKAFTKLLRVIEILPLAKPRVYHPDYSSVRNKVLMEARDKICTDFAPERRSLRTSLTIWINECLRLRYQIIELFKPQKTVSIDNQPNVETGDTYKDLISNEDSLNSPRLDGLDQLFADELQDICTKLREYIETDPEGRLRNCHPPTYPQWNCQEFVKRRYFRQPNQPWKEISQELNIPDGSPSPEANRRFFPLLKEIAKNLGY